jgi:prophage regulatory protein
MAGERPTVILRCREVRARTGLPKSSLYHLVQVDRFPKPVQLSGRRVGWVEAEIEAWLQSRIWSRDAHGARQ